jgi:reductive dehalogenase
MPKVVSEPTYKKFVVGELQRFDEANHAFSRVDRGEIISPDKIPEGNAEVPVHNIFTFNPNRKTKRGYNRSNYALRWAGRTIDYMARKELLGREYKPNAPPVEIDDARRMTDLLKKTAKWFGADLVGVAPLNRAWIYSKWGDHSVKFGIGTRIGDPIELPEYFTHIIVMAIAMDFDLTQRSPALEPTSDLGYSRMAFTAPTLARFIQELGYHAMPSGNDTALSVPMAVDAGLGEMGRNGILITDKYGPRVRLCKVFTDLPLVHDKPVDLGVQAFCEVCGKCADHCPGQALKHGERTAEHNNISNNGNLLKWSVDAERCIQWWVKNRSHCTNCIRVCPFNKPDTPLHRFVKWMVTYFPQFNTFNLKMDDLVGYGKQVFGDAKDEF